jgi:RND family efflux transporter MFP subunit
MRAYFAILLVLPLSALLLHGCGGDSYADDDSQPYLHLASTAPIHLESGFLRLREYAGEVQAHQSSLLGFELPGQLSQLLVNEGDAVSAGQLLARLDTRLLESERDELKARVEQLDAELQLALRNLERVSALRSNNLSSEREQDELASQVTVVRASLQQLEAALASNAVRLQQSELRAPFAARVASREVDSGVVVAAGAPVFRLVESALREVRAGLPQSIAEGLRPGAPLSLRMGEQEAVGTVLAVGPMVDPATRSRSVRVALAQDWPPGSLAYIGIEEQVPVSGAWLPDTAVTEGLRGTWVAYVAVPEGDARYRIEARSVVIHHARDGRLFVSGAIGDGEQALLAGLHRYAPGQLVRVDAQGRVADARTQP